LHSNRTKLLTFTIVIAQVIARNRTKIIKRGYCPLSPHPSLQEIDEWYGGKRLFSG